MGQYVLLLVVALTVGAVVFGVTVLVSGGDPGLSVAEPDGRAVPLPTTRPLGEADLSAVRFDTAVRGYRMAQVDQAIARAAYDIGYKDELIGVLEAEIAALREGREADAEVLRRAREAALATSAAREGAPGAEPDTQADTQPAMAPTAGDAEPPAPASSAPASSAPASSALEPTATGPTAPAGTPAAPGATPAVAEAEPAAPEPAASEGAEPRAAGPDGAEPGGAEPGGAGPDGAEPGTAEPEAASAERR